MKDIKNIINQREELIKSLAILKVKYPLSLIITFSLNKTLSSILPSFISSILLKTSLKEICERFSIAPQ